MNIVQLVGRILFTTPAARAAFLLIAATAPLHGQSVTVTAPSMTVTRSTNQVQVAWSQLSGPVRYATMGHEVTMKSDGTIGASTPWASIAAVVGGLYSDVVPKLSVSDDYRVDAGSPVSIAAADVAAPTIDVSPQLLVFSSYVGTSPAPQFTAIRNSSSGALAWRVDKTRPLAPWLSVTPGSGTAPDSLNVIVSSAGMPAGTYGDTIYLLSNDPATPRQPLPVVLNLKDPPPSPSAAGMAGAFARYEVELTYIGYTGLIDAAPDCKVNTQGYDRLIGVVSGFEPQAPDEDVVYTGTLGRTTNIDYCETRKAPTDDQRAYCVISLVGFGVTDVELTLSAEDGRGAYMQAAALPGPMSSTVSSDCDPPETTQARIDYHVASDLGAASPNGQPIDDTNAVDHNNRPITFAVNNTARLRVGTYPPDLRASPKGGWTLRVKRKLP